MNVLLDDYKSIDDVGNRLTKVAGSTTSYTYDNADRMTTAGGVTYTYDNNGNQTGRGADVFGWDIEDRLVSATVGANAVSYNYRGDDLRHSKTEAGVTTIFTWDLAAELPVVLQEGNTSYVYGLGLISQTTGSTTSYPLGDGLGSTAALTDSSGTVTATYKYDVFGAVKSSTGPGSTEFRFAGQQDDLALGYQYLRARYYDPSTGRFISKDPFGGFDDSPQSQNPFAYALNNPVSFADPSGNAAIAIPLAWLGLATIAALGIEAAEAPRDDLALAISDASVATGNFLRNAWDKSCEFVGGLLAEDQDWLSDEAKAKVPSSWGEGKANQKSRGGNKLGTRWVDPSNQGNGIRIDKGDPGSSNPSQQVDHVVVRRGGKVIGPDGQPISGSIKNNPQAHIPKSDWLRWKEWFTP
jgi:RHS repeat-associated protein